MSFFNKIYDIMHTDLFKYIFHLVEARNLKKVFVANVSKITIFNKDVLDSNFLLIYPSERVFFGCWPCRQRKEIITGHFKG